VFRTVIERTGLTATAFQLQEYGFPPKPSGGAALKSWETTMASYKSTPIPDISAVMGKFTPAFTSSGAINAAYNSHWAGWLADSNYQEFVAAQSDYTQPTAESTACSPTGESTWTGLGGWNSGNLVQDGTAINEFGLTYSAWYEYLSPSNPNPAKLLGNITVHAGDSMHVYVAYETSNGYIDFYVADNTDGESQPAYASGVGTSYYDGSSADYITERPVINGALTWLQRFPTYSTSTDQAETTSGSWIPISSSPFPYKVIMTSDGSSSGTPLATPSSLNSSGDGFSVTWDNCS